MLLLEDCGFELVQLVPEVIGDVGHLVEEGDGDALALVVDDDQGAGLLELVQVHLLDAGGLHFKCSYWYGSEYICSRLL